LIGAENLINLLIRILSNLGESLVSLADHLNGEEEFIDLISWLQSLVVQNQSQARMLDKQNL